MDFRGLMEYEIVVVRSGKGMNTLEVLEMVQASEILLQIAAKGSHMWRLFTSNFGRKNILNAKIDFSKLKFDL